MDSVDAYFYLAYAGAFLLFAGINYAQAFFTFGPPNRRLNATGHWTPVPDFVAENPPVGTVLVEYQHRIVTRYLEPGEELEGFAHARFNPPRPQDYGFARGGSGFPVLIAATPHRLLMFEVTHLTLHRYCSIPFEQIDTLRPPQPAMMGSSGPMTLGLKSGFEYRLQFYGPLYSEDGMSYEHKLATFLRWLAPRFADSQRAVA